MGDAGPKAVHVAERGDLSRGALLARGALAAGAFYGLGAVGPYVRQALAASGGGDLHILSFFLELEYVQSALYEEAPQRLGKQIGDLKPLIEMLASEEGQHVEALRAMITKFGGKPPLAGRYEFDAFKAESFLVAAADLELTSIGAYNGAIPMIESKDVMALAASIVQVEGRHAARVLIRNKREPAPEAFDPASPEDGVLIYLKEFTAA